MNEARLYKTEWGIVIDKAGEFLVVEEDWDKFINDDDLLVKVKRITKSSTAVAIDRESLTSKLLAPIGNQELWACGVTYLRSKVGRQEESKTSGSSDFYAKVYEAERPEIFFKASPHRVVGPGMKVRIRKDSTWDVPEPELTLLVTSSGKLVGYTIGNDMSSRSIEGQNPLYLPQAKTYDGCAAVGPCIYITDKPIDLSTTILLEIYRNGKMIFSEGVTINKMKRNLAELVSYVYKECTFPFGCLIMTGTGIVPSNDFTLHSRDEIRITIDKIGTLINTVQ